MKNEYKVEETNEQMDKIVVDAKGDFESFCQNKINAIASTSLVEHRGEFIKLEIPADTESK